MTDARITVYSPRFSVPGVIVETGRDTVRIRYHTPGSLLRSDWFYALNGGARGGQRMGDSDEPPVRYSVSPTMPDEAA